MSDIYNLEKIKLTDGNDYGSDRSTMIYLFYFFNCVAIALVFTELTMLQTYEVYS